MNATLDVGYGNSRYRCGHESPYFFRVNPFKPMEIPFENSDIKRFN